MTSFTLGELAQRFGLELHGNAATAVRAVATLQRAGNDAVAFLANTRYRRELANTRAAAVVLRAEEAAASPVPVLVARDPYVAFARIAALFGPDDSAVPGVHPSAVVDASAVVDPSAEVGPFVCIGARSRIGAGAVVGAGSVIGPDCVVGAGSRLVARVTLVTRVRLGERVLAHPGVVIGADGFGLAMTDGHWLKVPQLGGVLIGDDCEIGANTTIDRGALDDTVLGNDVRLDNQIQIAHNVVIGDHTAMAGCAAVAGSARIGRYCLIGGAAGVLGHIELADRVTITAMSLVSHSIREPGEYSSGTPLMANRDWRRSAARFKQLDRLARRSNPPRNEPE